jgi:deoxycytidylate deaminase
LLSSSHAGRRRRPTPEGERDGQYTIDISGFFVAPADAADRRSTCKRRKRGQCVLVGQRYPQLEAAVIK